MDQMSDGDMFTRTAKLSDKFVKPYRNDQEAKASNGGAYPPDMSVLVKARSGGAELHLFCFAWIRRSTQ